MPKKRQGALQAVVAFSKGVGDLGRLAGPLPEVPCGDRYSSRNRPFPRRVYNALKRLFIGGFAAGEGGASPVVERYSATEALTVAVANGSKEPVPLAHLI
jgi:hypothetical protein